MAFDGNPARFTIDGSPSEDANGNRGVIITNGATVTLQIEVIPSPALSITFQLFDLTLLNSPLASLSAPVVNFIGSGTPLELLTDPDTQTSTFTFPASGVEAYLVRCTATTPAGPKVFERLVGSRGVTSNLRKTVPAESQEFESRGWNDELNRMVDAIEGLSIGATDVDAIHDNVAAEISPLTLVTADGADHILIEDASDSDNKKRILASDFLGGGAPTGPAGGELGGTYPNPTVNDGADATAFHDNVAGEIAALPSVVVEPIDPIIIEDNSDSNNKKRVTAQAIADLAPAPAHSSTIGQTPNDHHNEAHTIASHSDTTATGAELETLTDGSDADALHDHASAIHDDVAGEISALTLVTAAATDHVLIEDASDTNNKKRVQVSDFIDSTDSDAIHDNVAGEISALVLETVAAGDHVLIEDASDSNNKKRIQASDFLSGDADAIHDNVADEISPLMLVVAAAADHVLIEDASDLNNKKRVSAQTIADLAPAPAHSATTGQTADDHHDQLHSIASHNDTSATGAELDTLTDGSDADALHDHATAIHDNVASEISALTLVTVVGTDHILIEDASDTNNKKRIQASDLLGAGTDADAIHDNVAAEISPLTLVTVAAGDHILIEDASDSDNKKRILASDLIGGGGGSGDLVAWDINQTSHGLSVRDVVRGDSSGDYVQAQANSGATLGLFVVTAVAGANDFTIGITGHYTDASHGLTIGDYYFLDATTPGALTATEPSAPNFSNPIIFVEDANTLVIVPWRPSDPSGASEPNPLANVISGVITGGVVTIATDPAEFNVSAGTGVIIDWSTPSAPVYTSVTWGAFSDQTTTDLATELFTGLLINTAGALVQIGGANATPQQRRQNIVLDTIVHVNNTAINAISISSISGYEAVEAVLDYILALGPVNSGNQVIANGANLNIDKTSGETVLPFINRQVDGQDTATRDNPADTVLSFILSYQDGVGGFVTVPANTVLDPDFWDDGTGTLNTVANNNWTIQRCYFFGQTGNYSIVYGQAEYANEAAATAAIFSENPNINPLITDTGTFVTAIIIEEGTTDAAADAIFIPIETAVSGGGGVVTDATAIHDNIAAEFTAVVAKGTPVGADTILIEDSADLDNKKSATITNIVAGAPPQAHTIASHSDTTATGAELETLTDGSDADALHVHALADTHIASTANPHGTDLGNIGSGTLAELNTAVQDATLDDSGDSRTPSGTAGGDLNGTYPNPGVDDGADATAIHDNQAAEISALVLVTTAATDHILIEDASDTNNKKRVSAQTIADLAPAPAHSATTGQTADDHHSEAHTIASHSDTTATGAELETLTNGSDADALHIHAIADAHIASTTNPHATDLGNLGSGTLAELNTAVTDATLDTNTASRPPSGTAGGDLNGTYPNPSVDDGADGTAIHDNVAGEISVITLVTAATGDHVLIEDLSDTNNKKRVTAQTIANLAPAPAHSATTGQTADDHHNEAHTVASHSDTTATGAELETLTNGSDADALHVHAIADTHIASTVNPHATDIGNLGSGTLAELNTAVTDATLDTNTASRPPSGTAGGDLGGTYPNPTVDDGADGSAIHDNVAAEISVLTLVTVATGDHVLIEDASDADNKKRILASDFLAGGAPSGPAGGDLNGTYPNPGVDDGADSTAIHDNVAAEISVITEKSAAAPADLVLIEDSAAANVKKRVQITNLAGAMEHHDLIGLGDDDHTQYLLVSGTRAMTGDLNINSNALDNYARARAELSVLGTSGNLNIDCNLGNHFTCDLTGNVTSVTITNEPASGDAQSVRIHFTQDTTPRTIPAAWTGVDWWTNAAGGPVMPTGSGKALAVVLDVVGGKKTAGSWSAEP